MIEIPKYPIGAPCWVESLQPDVNTAVTFYSELFGWSFQDSGSREYHVARLNGRRVAGMAQAPAMLDRGAWVSYVLVADLDEVVSKAQQVGGSLIVGPLKGPSDERSALLSDPSGAVFGVRQGSSPTVAELSQASGTWQKTALHSPNLAAAATFYGAVFGWRFEAKPDSEITQLRLAAAEDELADLGSTDEVIAVATESPAAAGVPAHWAVNVQITDADDFAARVLELGGSLLMPPSDAPGFRNVIFADPNGGVLGASQLI
ncbi:VOC family protein [Psychromicrobium lacuslunae]|uniref:VOC domain-containing protein n=1 Tax=Psychromicrobium lacuslunae TaxID=1618207 RepID=A0A0D4BXN5_9MICC|nr:VOC family protein [Psychromicrobium lacuslunae]AJT41073.1 hypothetical protein UM93_05250 [Psychromicrobium lacuslunae]